LINQVGTPKQVLSNPSAASRPVAVRPGKQIGAKELEEQTPPHAVPDPNEG